MTKATEIKTYTNPLIEALTEERTRRGHSIKEMLAGCGLSYTYYTELAKGGRSTDGMRPETLAPAAEYLGVTMFEAMKLAGRVREDDMPDQVREVRLELEAAFLKARGLPFWGDFILRDIEQLPNLARVGVIRLLELATEQPGQLLALSENDAIYFDACFKALEIRERHILLRINTHEYKLTPEEEEHAKRISKSLAAAGSKKAASQLKYELANKVPVSEGGSLLVELDAQRARCGHSIQQMCDELEMSTAIFYNYNLQGLKLSNLDAKGCLRFANYLKVSPIRLMALCSKVKLQYLFKAASNSESLSKALSTICSSGQAKSYFGESASQLEELSYESKLWLTLVYESAAGCVGRFTNVSAQELKAFLHSDESVFAQVKTSELILKAKSTA